MLTSETASRFAWRPFPSGLFPRRLRAQGLRVLRIRRGRARRFGRRGPQHSVSGAPAS